MLASSYISPKARKGGPSAIEGRGLTAIRPIAKDELRAINRLRPIRRLRRRDGLPMRQWQTPCLTSYLSPCPSIPMPASTSLRTIKAKLHCGPDAARKCTPIWRKSSPPGRGRGETAVRGLRKPRSCHVSWAHVWLDSDVHHISGR
jgi:hypothetical protein